VVGVDVGSVSLYFDLGNASWSLTAVTSAHEIAPNHLIHSFVNLSNPSRRLATEDPTSSFYLPVDTQDWDDDVAHFCPKSSMLLSY
jgi:hypothetical protein